MNWLQDLFPEVAAASGIRIMQGALGRVVARLRDRNLRGVDLNIVVGERAAAYLQSRSTQGLRVAIVHNWADGSAIRSVPSQSNRLRTEWSMERTFVVGYSGNMGRVHDFRTIVEAADALRDAADIVFLFIGGGRHRDWIEAEVRRRGLGNVRFRPYQPRERLGESLSVPDAHLLSLRREMEGLVVPSKFYGIAAAARPTIFIGDHDGEIARIVREGDCGRVVSEGDSEGLAACIRELRDDGPLRQRLGENARRIFEERFEKRIALEKWRQLLIEVAQKP
jgi:glycosyltransferase involved in cell wall biosynthesis